MTRASLVGSALLLAPLAALFAACAASPSEEAQRPVVVSTEGEPASSTHDRRPNLRKALCRCALALEV